MTDVQYYCPRCETVGRLEREGYLADKSVTSFPLEGWTYVDVGGDYDGADGVRIRCGAAASAGEGCGEPFYLDFVRFADGREVEPPAESAYVDLSGTGPSWPRGQGSEP